MSLWMCVYLSTFTKHKMNFHCFTQLWIYCFYLVKLHIYASKCKCMYVCLSQFYVYLRVWIFEKIIFIEAFELIKCIPIPILFCSLLLVFRARSFYSSPTGFFMNKKMKNHFDWNRKKQNHFLCLLSHIGLVRNDSPLPKSILGRRSA